MDEIHLGLATPPLLYNITIVTVIHDVLTSIANAGLWLFF